MSRYTPAEAWRAEREAVEARYAGKRRPWDSASPIEPASRFALRAFVVAGLIVLVLIPALRLARLL